MLPYPVPGICNSGFFQNLSHAGWPRHMFVPRFRAENGTHPGDSTEGEALMTKHSGVTGDAVVPSPLCLLGSVV